MILPTKHISQDRALLTVGAKILLALEEPKTVSSLWESLSRESKSVTVVKPPLRFDSFILALDLLNIVDAIEMDDGLIKRRKQ